MTPRQQPDNVTLLPNVPVDLTATDAENALLQIVFKEFRHFPAISSRVSANDFTQPIHRACWVVLNDLFAAQGVSATFDRNMIAQKIAEAYEDIDKSVALRVLVDTLKLPIGVGNAEYYIEQMEDAAQRSRLYTSLNQRLRDIRDRTKAVDETIDDVLADFTGIAGETTRAKDAAAGIAEFKARLATGDQFTPTGYKQIDEGGGLQIGKVCMVGGGAGMGKTTFALSLLHNKLRAEAQAPSGSSAVVHFSFEMKAVQIWTQILAMETRIYRKKLLRPQSLTPVDEQELSDAYARCGAYNYIIEDTFTKNTPMSVRRRLAIHAAAHPIGLVLIDGLWLMQPDPYVENGKLKEIPENNLRAQYMSMTRALIQLADDYNVPIMLVHQYNGDFYNAKQPRLTHLVGGLASSQNMERVWLMSREDYDDPGAEEAPLLVREAKSREFGYSGKPYKFHYEWTANRYEEREEKRDLTLD